MVSCVTGCGTNSCLSQCLHLAIHIGLGHDRQGRQQSVRPVQAMAGPGPREQEARGSSESGSRSPVREVLSPVPTLPISSLILLVKIRTYV